MFRVSRSILKKSFSRKQTSRMHLVPPQSPIERCSKWDNYLKINKCYKLHPQISVYNFWTLFKTIYCEETDEDLPIFDWDSIEPRIKYEVDTLAERVDNIRLTVDISDIENFPIEYEGEEYSLSDVALISKNGPKEFLVDFIEYPELFEQVANALHWRIYSIIFSRILHMFGPSQ